MTMWSIQRIDNQAGLQSGLLCIDPEFPALVTLKDKDTGDISTINICVRSNDPNPCAFLTALKTAGYTPADWDTECP